MFLNKLLQIIQIILKIAGIILLILAVGAFVLLNINWKIFYTDKDAEIPPNMITPTPIVFMSPTPVIINTSVKSLNDPDIKLINSDNAENMFVEYFKQIYSIISPEWTGDQYEALKITLNNFTTDNFNSYKNWLDLQKVSKTIPTELNSIYLTTQASKDFIAVIQSAQSDFIKYLQALNINSSYINEIITNTLPVSNDRITIVSTNTSTEPESGIDYIKNAGGDVASNDYSKLKMIFYTNDIYKYAKIFKESSIINANNLLSTENIDLITRDMSLRYITFKSMTSALQRAVETINSPDKYKTDKDSYLKSIKSLANITNLYELNWGGLIYTQMNNRNIMLRRQSDYLSLEVLSSVYNLSSNQHNNLLTSLYSKYHDLGTELRNQITEFSTKYPQYPLDNLPSKILSDFISRIDVKNINRQTIFDINKNFALIDNYVADYTYLSNSEISSFWDYLK